MEYAIDILKDELHELMMYQYFIKDMLPKPIYEQRKKDLESALTILSVPQHETPKVSINKLTKEVCINCIGKESCIHQPVYKFKGCKSFVKQTGR